MVFKTPDYILKAEFLTRICFLEVVNEGGYRKLLINKFLILLRRRGGFLPIFEYSGQRWDEYVQSNIEGGYIAGDHENLKLTETGQHHLQWLIKRAKEKGFCLD